MTREQFEVWVRKLDPVNAEYILADSDIQHRYQTYLRWKNKDSINVKVIQDSGNKDVDGMCKRIAEDVLHELEEATVCLAISV